MEIIYLSSAVSLVLFMILASYDGAYLHLWKYELFLRKESKFEHLTHSIRAFLFPLIVWFLFINHDELSLIIGASLLIIDFIVLGIDAYSEKESRAFMEGLPRSEYIMHLFANGFHFASIFLVLSTKFTLTDSSISFANAVHLSSAKELFDWIAFNVLPGAIVLAILHFLLMIPRVQQLWTSVRVKVRCC